MSVRRDIWQDYWLKENRLERFINWYKELFGYNKLINSLDIEGIKSSLEVGAGKATISKELRNRGVHAVACDNDTWSIELYKDEVSNYCYSEADNLDFDDKSFDLVFSCGLFEHLSPKYAKKALAEMKRVGNKVVIMMPSCNWLWRTLWKLRGVPDGRLPKIQFNGMVKNKVILFGLFDYIIYESSLVKPTTAESCSGSNA